MITEVKISRMRRGVMQKDLAAKMGVTGGYLSLIESRKVKAPAQRQQQIAGLLGKQESDFFGEDGYAI